MRLELRWSPPGRRDRLEGLVAAAALAAGVVGAGVAARAAPLADLPSLCLFRLATGLPCPGCGLVRAAGLLARGHPADALAMNPFGTLALALGAPAALVWSVLRARGASVRVSLTRTGRVRLAWILGAAGAANWIYLAARGI